MHCISPTTTTSDEVPSFDSVTMKSTLEEPQGSGLSSEKKFKMAPLDLCMPLKGIEPFSLTLTFFVFLVLDPDGVHAHGQRDYREQ